MNEIIVSGRITKDPVIRQTKTGKKVTSFTVAAQRPFLNAEGKRDADFIGVTVYGKAVDAVKAMGKKNQPVLVKGRLQTTSRTSASGENYLKHEVIAYNVEFLCTQTLKEETEKETCSYEETDVTDTFDLSGLAEALN